MANVFNIRVYGLLVMNEAILVSDEFIKKNKITKLPGGGLEYGEGTIDCVIREFKEELNLDIEVKHHFYTTDFFVNSSFDNKSQVVSIYYMVKPIGELTFKVSDTAHNYEKKDGAQAFRWIKIKDLKETDFTLIIDRKVAELMIQTFKP